MNIYCVEIPIPNYEQNDYFLQRLFFNKPPTRSDVIDELNKRHDEDSKYMNYPNKWEYCLESVEAVQVWEQVSINSIWETSTHIDVKINNILIKSCPFVWKIFEVVQN